MSGYGPYSMPETVPFGGPITLQSATTTERGLLTTERRPYSTDPGAGGSVAALQELNGPPPGHQLLVRRGRRLRLAARQRRQARRHQPRGVVLADVIVRQQVHQAAVVELHDRARVELLQPAGTLLDRLGDRR